MDKELIIVSNRRRWLVSKLVTVGCLIILAVFVYFVFQQFLIIVRNIEKIVNLNNASNPQATLKQVFKKLSSDELLILNGDVSVPTKLLQQKAIHQKFPKNRIYLANYISYLSAEPALTYGSYQHLSKKEKEIILQKNRPVLEAINYAEKLEPDNALYNYFRSYILLNESLAVNNSEQRKEYLAKLEVKSRKEQYLPFSEGDSKCYYIVDEKKYDAAIQEFLKGVAKPYFRSYCLDMTIERIKIKYDSIETFAQQLDQALMHMATRFPHLLYVRTVTDAVIYKAKCEFKKGNVKQAESLIDKLLVLVKQTAENCDNYNEMLNNLGWQRIVYKAGCEIYNEIGNKEKLAYFEKKYQLEQQLVDILYRKIFPDELELFKREGFFAGMILPKINPVENETILFKKLKPERMMSYKVAEIVVLFVYAVVFTIMNIGLWILGTRAYKSTEIDCEENSLEMIIKPTWRKVLMNFLFGTIIPVIVYLLITNIDIISGRYYLLGNLNTAVYQIIFLFISIAVPIFIVINYDVKKVFSFCLGGENLYRKSVIQGGIIYGLGVLGSTVLLPNMWFGKITSYSLLIMVSRIFGLLLGLIGIVLMLYFIIFLRKKTALYYRLVIINSLPYFAVATVLGTGLLFVTFKFQLDYYFRKDKCILVKDPKVRRTYIEYQAMQKAKRFVLEKILNDIK